MGICIRGYMFIVQRDGDQSVSLSVSQLPGRGRLVVRRLLRPPVPPVTQTGPL